ncbi:MAG TPA: PAS domain S-box protein, partial [Chthoniobacteraceae bacterium]|nr:PAS domain S-box protein [Chthoniobacteraceae bacterium]
TPEQIVGKTDAEIHRDAHEVAGFQAIDRRVIESKRTETVEETFTSETGEKHIFLTTKTPRFDADGNVIGLVGVAHDITARKATEHALRESDQRLGGIIGSAMDAIISVDAGQRIVLFNPAAEKMFGYAAADVLDQLLEKLIPGRFRNAHSGHVAHFGETGTTSRQMGALGQLAALRADGSEFPIEASISQAQIGAQKFFTVILRDVTERDRAAVALQSAKLAAEAANQAKDDFLAALSHELRTPLNPVLLTASELRRDERLPDDVREALEMMRRNIALEARLIDDLLDLTRITRGRLQLRPERCDAHTLLGYAIEIVQAEIAAKDLRLSRDFAAKRPWVEGDPARLQQVFWNVLKNAVKFTPRDGDIRLRTRNGSDGQLVIEISDTGIGFAPEMSERIFAPFEQAGLANVHRFGGLGLGLAISHAVIEQHRGTITASSEGENRGATFRIELPSAFSHETDRATDGTGATKPGAAPLITPAGRPLRLLVIEDHESTLATLGRLLSRAGHNVTCAGSAASALEAARATAFDAVISDIGLPDASGHELLSQLRALQPGLGAIALSGYGMEDDLRLSEEAGFHAHLIKPV